MCGQQKSASLSHSLRIKPRVKMNSVTCQGASVPQNEKAAFQELGVLSGTVLRAPGALGLISEPLFFLPRRSRGNPK